VLAKMDIVEHSRPGWIKTTVSDKEYDLHVSVLPTNHGQSVVLRLMDKESDRIHAWHLFPIRLRLDRLAIDRNEFIAALRERGVGCSVHWRPLHLHPYYAEQFGWSPDQFPVASALWDRS